MTVRRVNATTLLPSAATPPGTLLVAAVLAAVCGAVVHRHGFVMLAAIGSTMVVGVGWPWLATSQLRAGLSFDADRGREGQPIQCRLAIRNRGPLPVAGLTLLGSGGSAIHVATVGAFGTLDLPLTVHPQGRGIFPAGVVTLACGLPLGLWQSKRVVRVARPVLVWPSPWRVALPAELQGRRVGAMDLAGAATTSGDENHGVRPYRRGDPVRLVHHAQTARHDRLIVRERSGTARPAVRIALDSAVASYGTAGREDAIRIAAGLCAACAGGGLDVDAVVEGRVVRSGRDLLDALARIGEPGGLPAGDLVRSPACRGRARQLVMVTSALAAGMVSGNTIVVTVEGVVR